MIANNIMDLYTKYERNIQINRSNSKVVADKYSVKCVYDDGRSGFIGYFALEDMSIDELIKREVDYFTQIDQEFEWKVYGTDSPSNIGERLIAHGFVQEPTESFLVLNINNYQPNLKTSPNIECKLVTSEQMFRDAFAIQNSEFPLNVDQHVESHWPLYSKEEDCSIYVIYAHGQPVASAQVDFTPSSIFAGLWAGTTLKAFRGNGYYQILLNYRINEAKLRGCQYMTIDALETSRPIVEKHGFEFITTTTPYIFTPTNH